MGRVRVRLVQATALAGICVSGYALHVEHELEQNPMFQPSCNAFGGSCSNVFSSSYAHVLSHWGIVPKGHALDLSLASAGLLLYCAYFLAISIPRHFPLREELFLAVALAGAAFSVWLLHVITNVLGDFCIVCTSFHCCNAAMLVLAATEYRSPSVLIRGHAKLS